MPYCVHFYLNMGPLQWNKCWRLYINSLLFNWSGGIFGFNRQDRTKALTSLSSLMDRGRPCWCEQERKPNWKDWYVHLRLEELRPVWNRHKGSQAESEQDLKKKNPWQKGRGIIWSMGSMRDHCGTEKNETQTWCLFVLVNVLLAIQFPSGLPLLRARGWKVKSSAVIVTQHLTTLWATKRGGLEHVHLFNCAWAHAYIHFLCVSTTT